MARSFLEFDAGSFFNNINKQFSKNIRNNVIPLIEFTIQSGVSPVKGKGSFKDYSDGYKKQIMNGRYRRYGKGISPVNMTLSGKMIRSFRATSLQRGGVSITNNNKLVKYHNDLGAGRSKVIRRLLPTKSGEQFRNEIQKEINQQLESAISVELKK